MANWQKCPAVERDPAKSGGVWVFRDTDIPLYRLYETLASGATVDDFAERFGVAVEHAAGVLEYDADELHDYRLDYRGQVPYARATRVDDGGPDDFLWRNCPLVEQAEGRLGGAWVCRNTRLPLYTLHDNLLAGATVADLAEWFSVERQTVKAILEYEAKYLQANRLAYADTV